MAIAAIRDAVVSDWAARLKDAHAMEKSFRTENVTAEYGSARVVNPRLSLVPSTTCSRSKSL